MLRSQNVMVVPQDENGKGDSNMLALMMMFKMLNNDGGLKYYK